MAKTDRVQRPQKKSEFELRFATAQAQKGWTDLAATMHNAMADAWDFLTRSPLTETPTPGDATQRQRLFDTSL